ncbi:aspartokinase 1, chloroplastic-like [Magnolia sinica]|uniref:aspartokinase 1, chloroplastic-like n=1 Tax=Magnolia sinica TaxID=86752 RepID=UPI002659E5E1|nr:aspartokinase 1, chloroplastic-like [Magnolia sinica]
MPSEFVCMLETSCLKISLLVMHNGSAKGKAALLTVGSLVVGVAVGSVVENWLQEDSSIFWHTLLTVVGIIGVSQCRNATYPAVAERLRGDWISDLAIPVVTGFLGKGQKSWAVTTLGKGESDLTATTIGKALGLREIQVWKYGDGFLTCNPNIYQRAEPVPYFTFDEAAELAYFGAQVLHPQSMRPAREADIPVRVKNFCNPNALRILITRAI